MWHQIVKFCECVTKVVFGNFNIWKYIQFVPKLPRYYGISSLKRTKKKNSDHQILQFHWP
jgi:hypothetical protein